MVPPRVTRRQKEDWGIKRRNQNEETPADEGTVEQIGISRRMQIIKRIQKTSEEILTKRPRNQNRVVEEEEGRN